MQISKNHTLHKCLDATLEVANVGSAGRTGGRAQTAGAWPRPGGWAGGKDDFERQYNNFHRLSQTTLKNTLCFSVVLHPADAQVPIFTAQMKKASQKTRTNTVFFDFSNQANAQVPIFTVQNSIFEHLRQSRGSPGSRGNGARSAAPNPPTTRRGSG